MLTDAQKNIIENSQWIVNTVLKSYGVSHDNDLRQSANLYLCECISRYNPSKGAKWETYAYSGVKYHVKSLLNKQFKRNINICGFDVEGTNGKEKGDNFISAKLDVEEVLSVCNQRERRVLELLKEGWTSREISKIINRSPSTVSLILKEVRLKLGVEKNQRV